MERGVELDTGSRTHEYSWLRVLVVCIIIFPRRQDSQKDAVTGLPEKKVSEVRMGLRRTQNLLTQKIR